MPVKVKCHKKYKSCHLENLDEYLAFLNEKAKEITSKIRKLNEALEQ